MRSDVRKLPRNGHVSSDFATSAANFGYARSHGGARERTRRGHRKIKRPMNATTSPSTAASAEELKRAAAARALAYVEPGMRLGLGTGSTARHFVELLAE